MSELFDRTRRARARDRAASHGGTSFLAERMFDECLDRLAAIRATFERALLIGCNDPGWVARLGAIAGAVDCVDPGPRFADAAGGECADEDRHDFGTGRYDLCVAVGTLDTVNDLRTAFRSIRVALRPNAPLIGALIGGHSFPALRQSMIEAGRVTGRNAARTHPRIDPSSLTSLLADAGFQMPVVDVERLRLRYRDLAGLVRDLRELGGINVLAGERPYLGKAGLKAANSAFAGPAEDGRTEESVEILHFLGWTILNGQAPD